MLQPHTTHTSYLSSITQTDLLFHLTNPIALTLGKSRSLPNRHIVGGLMVQPTKIYSHSSVLISSLKKMASSYLPFGNSLSSIHLPPVYPRTKSLRPTFHSPTSRSVLSSTQQSPELPSATIQLIHINDILLPNKHQPNEQSSQKFLFSVPSFLRISLHSTVP